MTQRGRSRRLARRSAVEALYAWQAGGADAAELPRVLAEVLGREDRRQQDEAFVREAVLGVAEHRAELDEAIGQAARGRSLRSIGAMELAILRLGAWELRYRLEIPYRVVISEALRLAGKFTEPAAKRFINGVLDALARRWRALEVEGGAQKIAPRRAS